MPILGNFLLAPDHCAKLADLTLQMSIWKIFSDRLLSKSLQISWRNKEEPA